MFKSSFLNFNVHFQINVLSLDVFQFVISGLFFNLLLIYYTVVKQNQATTCNGSGR